MLLVYHLYSLNALQRILTIDVLRKWAVPLLSFKIYQVEGK